VREGQGIKNNIHYQSAPPPKTPAADTLPEPAVGDFAFIRRMRAMKASRTFILFFACITYPHNKKKKED
jgi:hypothetical protein